MSVNEIFDELKLIKMEHDRCEKMEKKLGVGMVVLLVVFFILGKIDLKNVYWSIWIVGLFGVLMDTSKKDYWEKQKKLALEYRNVYKDNLIPMVLNNYYEVIQYARVVNYNREELKYITYFVESEPVIVKNYFEGKHNGVNFLQAVILSDVIHSGGYGDFAYFRGRFFLIEICKNVDFVYIYSKNYRNKPRFMKELDRLETEDLEFNEYFDIAAVNSEEAFYVLTPHFMYVLMDLYQRFGSLGVLCKNRHIYVIFSQLNEQSNDIDTNIFKDLDYHTETSRIKNFFGLVNVLIDELGMNLCATDDEECEDEDKKDDDSRKINMINMAYALVAESEDELRIEENGGCNEI